MAKSVLGSSFGAGWAAGLLVWGALLAGLAAVPASTGFDRLTELSGVAPVLTPMAADAALIEAGYLEPTGHEVATRDELARPGLTSASVM